MTMNENEPVACQYCDNTGDVHSIDGEWRGKCTECNPAPAVAVNEQLLEALKVAQDLLFDADFDLGNDGKPRAEYAQITAAIAAAEAEKAKGSA